jgi:hypothetical protein
LARVACVRPMFTTSADVPSDLVRHGAPGSMGHRRSSGADVCRPTLALARDDRDAQPLLAQAQPHAPGVNPIPAAFYQHALVNSYEFVQYCRNLAIFFPLRCLRYSPGVIPTSLL